MLSLVTVFLTAEVDNGTSEDRYEMLLLQSQLWEVGGRELARRKEAWDTVFFEHKPGRKGSRGVGGVAGGGRGGRGEGQAANRKAGGGWQTEADERDRKDPG